MFNLQTDITFFARIHFAHMSHLYLIADFALLCVLTLRYAVLRFNQYFKMKLEVAALSLPK